jgi:hypothetical protein
VLEGGGRSSALCGTMGREEGSRWRRLVPLGKKGRAGFVF